MDRRLSGGTLQGEMARRVRELDWASTPLGPIEGWSASLKLITQIVLAAGFPMALRWGPALVFLYNDAYRPILGNKHPEALGRSGREVWSELYDELGPMNDAILRGERPAYYAEDQLWRIQRGHGIEDAHFSISYSPIPDETAPHGIGGVLTTCVETTERVRTEAALRELTGTLEQQVAQRTLERDRIWQVSEDLLGVTNFEGYFVSVNPAWTQLLGWSEDEIRRMPASQLRHPDDAAHTIAARNRLRAGAATVRVENRFRHKDGSWRWLDWTLVTEGGLIYVVGRDVTAEKAAEEALRLAQDQLAQSQKMEALGQLTGGIAHDFNNLLMVISGNTEILQERIREPRDRRVLDAIELAAARGENLTRQLLSFSRRQSLNPVVIDLAERLQASRDLLASSARGNIELAVEVKPDTWPVAVDVPEFELALVNVVVNARDAIPESGTITIAAENIELDEQDTTEGLAGEFVALAIRDTGLGIPPEILPKVFEPFFSTKQTDKGTGLGLSQVYGFTHQSGGTVTVGNRRDGGTVVTMYLPRSPSAVAEAPDGPQSPEAALAHERILLVEDNPDVREVAVMLLDQLGYEVLPVENAAAALELLGSDERVDLVFSDIVMPGKLNGIDLARQIREKYPDVRVLLTTGYAQAELNADPGYSVLRKPYRLGTLAEALREALGSGMPAA